MRQVYAFRPGELAKNYARWQICLLENGSCGVYITHGIADVAWRHTKTKYTDTKVSAENTHLIFNGIISFSNLFSNHCYTNEGLWADSSEKSNSITRTTKNNTLFLTFGVSGKDNEWEKYYSVPEDASPLCGQIHYLEIMNIVTPLI